MSSVAAEVAHIKADIKRLGPDGIRLAYGIEIKEDGAIWDVAYQKLFKSLTEWVMFCNEQDDDQQDYDDEYGQYNDED